MVTIVIGDGQGLSKKVGPQFPSNPRAGVITGWEAEISIPVLPRVGQPFEVNFRFRCHHNAWEQARFGPDYIFSFSTNGAIILTGEKNEFHGYMKKDDEKNFKATMIIDKPQEIVSIKGGIISPGSGYPGPFGYGLDIYLIDEEIGQYGSREQWLAKKYGVLAKYNNVEPQWLNEYDVSWVKSNRKIVSMMRQFEPTLSDSEALCLHQDNYLLIINAVGNSEANDEERIKHLLEAGWLKAQRSDAQTKEQWFNNLINENRGTWKGGTSNPNFFRTSNYSFGNISDINTCAKDRVTTTFIGT